MAVYSIDQVAAVCQVSTRTVQRRLPQLEAAGAWKGADGKWRVPIEAMAAAGLKPGQPARPDAVVGQPLRHHDMSHDKSYDSEVEVLRVKAEAEQQIAEWRRRAEVAEALAAERERIINTQAMALRMLEAAPAQPPAAEPTEPATPAPAEPAGLTGRLFRLVLGGR